MATLFARLTRANPIHGGGGKRGPSWAPSSRTVAAGCAVAWAYGGVAAIVTEHLVFVGPCAAGFVVCLFAAQLLGEPLQGEDVNVFHGLKFSPDELLNTTQQIGGPL